MKLNLIKLGMVALAIIAGLGEVVVDFKGSRLLGLVFLSTEILGRIYLVMADIAPSEGGDEVRIVIGGVTALAVILYAWSQQNNLD